MSTPHRDGWRNEYFFELVKDPACGSALASLMTAVVPAKGDVPAKAIDIVSYATLIVMLKKDQAAMDELKKQQGLDYRQPQRPIGTGTAVVKVACNCALLLV